MNRIILLFLLIPGNKINRYGEQPKSGFWDGTYLVVDPLNVSLIKSKLRKLWLDLIRRTDEVKDINKKTSIKDDVNVNIRMYNFDDVQCTVIPSVAYGFVTGMNLQLC